MIHRECTIKGGFRIFGLILLVVAGPILAQEYDTPSDHLAAEKASQAVLFTCLSGSGSYQLDIDCGEQVQRSCLRMSPHGETTAGLSICGGVTSNVLDRAINTVWKDLKQSLPDPDFSDLLQEQRNWLAFRKSQSEAASRRYSSGSMGAYSGWAEYEMLTVKRLARLREIARDGM